MPALSCIRVAAYRRSAVYLAYASMCVHCGVSVLLTLGSCSSPLATCSVVRVLQLAALTAQGCLCLHLALSKHQLPNLQLATITEMMDNEDSAKSLAALAPIDAGRGYLSMELLRILIHVSLSWYPVDPSQSPDTCIAPRIDILAQQTMATAGAALLGIPTRKVLLSWLLLPAYLLLDYRHALLNGLPGSETLLMYLSRRGLLMLLSRLFFSAIPALIMTQSHQGTVYGICLPLLSIQCFVSGMRVFHGIDHAHAAEVWVATIAAFGVGTDIGHVIEELRLQFSRVRMIALDILPHHVVDTLLMQQQDAPEPPPLPQQQPAGSGSSGGSLQAAAGSPCMHPHLRTASDADASPSLSSSISETLFAAGAERDSSGRPSWRAAAAGSPASGLSAFHVCQRPPTAAGEPAPPAGRPTRSQGRVSSSESLQLPLLHKRSSASKALSDPDEAEYAEEHPRACILFADVCGFSSMSEGKPPRVIVHMLNQLFRKFDDLVSSSPHLYKLDMIGDCYMAASGLAWHSSDPNPARTITDLGKLMLAMAATVSDSSQQEPLRIRMGIHCGPVVGALLGCLRRKYSCFGDVVNIASRLQSTSRPGAIHVSAEFYHQLQRDSDDVPLQLVETCSFSDPLADEFECIGRRSILDSNSHLTAGTGGSFMTDSYDCWDRLRHIDECDEAHAAADASSHEAMRAGGGRHGAQRAAAAAPRDEQDAMPSSFEDRLAGLCVLERAGSEEGPERAEDWQYQGRIQLKGRGPLETYLLQVL